MLAPRRYCWKGWPPKACHWMGISGSTSEAKTEALINKHSAKKP
jgi:hypothetical protein